MSRAETHIRRQAADARSAPAGGERGRAVGFVHRIGSAVDDDVNGLQVVDAHRSRIAGVREHRSGISTGLPRVSERQVHRAEGIGRRDILERHCDRHRRVAGAECIVPRGWTNIIAVGQVGRAVGDCPVHFGRHAVTRRPSDIDRGGGRIAWDLIGFRHCVGTRRGGGCDSQSRRVLGGKRGGVEVDRRRIVDIECKLGLVAGEIALPVGGKSGVIGDDGESQRRVTVQIGGDRRAGLRPKTAADPDVPVPEVVEPVVDPVNVEYPSGKAVVMLNVPISQSLAVPVIPIVERPPLAVPSARPRRPDRPDCGMGPSLPAR